MNCELPAGCSTCESSLDTCIARMTQHTRPWQPEYRLTVSLLPWKPFCNDRQCQTDLAKTGRNHVFKMSILSDIFDDKHRNHQCFQSCGSGLNRKAVNYMLILARGVFLFPSYTLVVLNIAKNTQSKCKMFSLLYHDDCVHILPVYHVD